MLITPSSRIRPSPGSRKFIFPYFFYVTSASFFSKRFKKNRKSINSTLSQYSLFEKKIELLHFKSIPSSITNSGVSISISIGELAQMVERPLSMREVPGSIPGFSKGMAGAFVLLMPTFYLFCFFFLSFGFFAYLSTVTV